MSQAGPSQAVVKLDRTRGRVVESAARRFAEYGIDRVSLDEIATSAGIHRTTLHRHFPEGRDELVLAVLDREVRQLAGRMLDLITDAPTAADALVGATAFAVVEGRRSKLVAALLSEPDTRSVVLGPAAGELRSTATGLWKLIRERPDATPPSGRGWPATDRVVDHLFRVILGLVEEAGPVRTPAQVRNYLNDFVVPGLLG